MTRDLYFCTAVTAVASARFQRISKNMEQEHPGSSWNPSTLLPPTKTCSTSMFSDASPNWIEINIVCCPSLGKRKLIPNHHQTLFHKLYSRIWVTWGAWMMVIWTWRIAGNSHIFPTLSLLESPN